MQPYRRRFLRISSAAALATLFPFAGGDAQNPTARGGRRRPDGSSDPSAESPDSPNTPNPTKTLLEERQKSIKKDVEKLFDLASELKTEVEKTDSTTVLSLPLVKKAEEIERLARQIKDHAKG